MIHKRAKLFQLNDSLPVFSRDDEGTRLLARTAMLLSVALRADALQAERHRQQDRGDFPAM